MPHIHTQPGQHDTTASAYIIRLDGSEPAIMLHRHRLLGTWLQFGGHVELHENPWQAIAHELAEESGYRLDQLQILQPPYRLAALSGVILHPLPIAPLTGRFGDTDHYHTDIGYAFITHEAPAGSRHAGESADIRSFTAAELRAVPDDQIIKNVREIGHFILEEALRYWVPVDTAAFALD